MPFFGGSRYGDERAFAHMSRYYSGEYELLAGHAVNARPVYQHTTQSLYLCMANNDSWVLSEKQWGMQTGEERGALFAASDDAITPDQTSATWHDNTLLFGSLPIGQTVVKLERQKSTSCAHTAPNSNDRTLT